MVMTIEERIRQRRAQMLVHSYLYYQLDHPLVSDDDWQRWANELAEIQKANPGKCKIGFFDRAFFGWDGTTGYHLPIQHPWVVGKAQQLLRINGVTL